MKDRNLVYSVSIVDVFEIFAIIAYSYFVIFVQKWISSSFPPYVFGMQYISNDFVTIASGMFCQASNIHV